MNYLVFIGVVMVLIVVGILWFLLFSKFSVRGNIKWIIELYNEQKESALSAGMSSEEFEKELKQDALLLAGKYFLGVSSTKGQEYNQRKEELERAIKKKKVRSLRQLISFLLNIVHPVEIENLDIQRKREKIIDRYYKRHYSEKIEGNNE